MGLALRILAIAALAALSACDRDVSRDDPDSSPQAPEQEVSKVVPAAPAMADQVKIADRDGSANALPGAGAGRLPLARILAIARARVPGQVIEVELDDEDGLAEYEVKILTADGRSIETKIDALSGIVLDSEED